MRRRKETVSWAVPVLIALASRVHQYIGGPVKTGRYAKVEYFNLNFDRTVSSHLLPVDYSLSHRLLGWRFKRLVNLSLGYSMFGICGESSPFMINQHVNNSERG